MKRLSFTLIFITFAGTLLGASQLPGSQYLYPGMGGAHAALGFTGFSDLGAIAGNPFNPASSADLRRLSSSFLLSGLSTETLYIDASLYIPSLVGVWGFRALYTPSWTTNVSAVLNHYYGASISLAKPITENLFWGFGLSGAQAWSGTNSDWVLTFDTGIIWADRTEKTGFGMNNLAWGVALRNIGKTAFITNTDPLPPMSIGAGAGFTLMNWDVYKMRLSADLTVPFVPFNTTLGLGMEQNILDILKLRVGYTLSLSNFAMQNMGTTFPLTLGLGLSGRIKITPQDSNSAVNLSFGKGRTSDYTDLELNYTLFNHSWNGREEWSHGLNLAIAFGTYDSAPPVVFARAETNWFSPNYDGVMDELKILLSIVDDTLVKGWQLDVRKDGKVIRTYKSLDRLEVKNLDAGKFFSQVFSVKSQAEIPPFIIWTGQDESGTRMPDGIYGYVLSAWDDNNNTNVSPESFVNIDTVIPGFTVSNDFMVFSPNGDGRKDLLTVTASSSNLQENDLVVAQLIDAAGNPVRRFITNSLIPASYTWDGTNELTNAAAEGSYIFKLTASDYAGNRLEKTISNIRLVTAVETPVIGVSPAVFSPNGDGVADSAQYSLSVSSALGLETWALIIQDAAGSSVRVISGSNILPAETVFDGRDGGGMLLPDGLYSARLSLIYDSGNAPVSAPVTVEIDNTAPRAVIKPEYLSFSPNNDGKQDTITFRQDITGKDADIFETRIADALGNVYYYNKAVKSDMPASYTWNGLDRDMKALPEGQYTYSIEAQDSVGNRSLAEVKNIFLKTGLEKVNVQANLAAFSPNSDGTNDKAVFAVTLSSVKDLSSVTLEIKDTNGNVVRTFESASAVDKWEWDGKDNNGQAVPDGGYIYQLAVKYTFGDNPKSAAKPIGIRANPPVLSVQVEDMVLSPNGDGRKDKITFKLKAGEDPSTLYEALLIGRDGAVIRGYRWTGSVPAELVWDGRDEKGIAAPEGFYTFVIRGTDIAKNQTMKTVPDIKLVRALPRASLTAAAPAWSPALTQLVFNTGEDGYSELDGLDRTELLIMDSTGAVVRKIVKLGDLEDTISFDGKDNKGAALPDGNYSARLELTYESGAVAGATVSRITLDRTPPAAQLTVAPEIFTPDGDGDADSLYINLDLSDLTAVKEWAVRIFKMTDDGKKGYLFKTFSGKGNIKQLIEWDGRGNDTNDMVESVQDYILELTAVDNVGNALPETRRTVSVGVLVDRTPDGIRIRVSSIQFPVNQSVMIGQSSKNMDKVILVIRKLLSDRKKYGIPENARIEIGGHTDDTGTDAFNNPLSEQRALAIYRYFISRDIDPAVLTYKGYGSTRPYKVITPEMPKDKKDEYRARNRRVELFIRK